MPTDAERLVEDTIALAEAVRDRSEFILRQEQENKAFQRALAAVVPPFEGESTEEWAERAFNGSSDSSDPHGLVELEYEVRGLKSENERLRREVSRLEHEVGLLHGWRKPFGSY